MSFEHEILRGLDLSRDKGRRVVPRDLESKLAAFGPTAILVGGFSPAVAGRVALHARRQRVPFGIWSGEISSRPTARQRVRRMQRTALVRHATFGVAYGSRALAYLRSLDPTLPVVIGRNTTPLPRRATGTASGRVELISVARAEPGKAIDVLVTAVRSRPRLSCRLTIIGDGRALPELRRLARGDERIRFLGALIPSETRRELASTDVFLFPSSYDVFGVAVVEAMGAGLATAVSPLPGAVDDLCISECNCLVVDGDAEAWADAIERLVEDRNLRERIGTEAAETIRCRWTIEHAADAMLAGFRLASLQGEVPAR
jgi:glycosyltransferase involved in cell wall biosynthesis